MKTITEGLQEIKTLVKRVQKKREFIEGYLWRNNQARDPHEKLGGSRELIKKELQTIKDLEVNIVTIRRQIAIANDNTNITVCNETKTISEWLIWRREIITGKKQFLTDMYSRIQRVRTQAIQKGMGIVESQSGAGVDDLIINIDEKALIDEIEKIEEIVSTLDGQLSLKNSTVNI